MITASLAMVGIREPRPGAPATRVTRPPTAGAAASRGRRARLTLDEDAAQLAGLEPALRLHRGEQRLAVEVAIAEVPAQHQAGDDLAVEIFVVLQPVDRARDQHRQRAALQVHQPEPHDLAEQADRGRAVVEPRQLIVDPRRGLGQPLELAVAVAAEQPHAVRPVAGVEPHREQERQPAGREVAEQRRADQHRGEEDRKRRRADALHGDLGVGPEQRERAVHHHDVPLDRHAERHVAGDERVEHEHEREADDQRCAAR
jgi:hypothetical protein